MRIEALEAFDIDEQLIEAWKSNGHNQLLPIQNEAVKTYGVLNGKNVLVVSPTSSGKTFIGEMAAVKTARKHGRALYLLPQKALAEEKYMEFKKKYSPLGIRTVISTRDRREFDQDIRSGKFHIAVIVFEKLQSLLVTNPTILQNVGTVVFDELQMIGDKERGAGIEVLLTKIRTSQSAPQIVCLSAVLGNAEHLAEWLNAGLCRTDRRPVELRKGVLNGGKFWYVEHNSGNKGSEEIGAACEEAEDDDILFDAVKKLSEKGEQCLVFCMARNECVEKAKQFSKLANLKPATRALAELSDLEDSEGNGILRQLLEKGIACHNTDLDWEQRTLVEKHFRSKDISVVFATTTLAVGMNMPARNAFVNPKKWDNSGRGQWMVEPIEQADYENMSGRAGRLGLEESFGRAIIVTQSKFDAGVYYKHYVTGKLPDIQPALGKDALSLHVLNLVASGIAKSVEDLRSFLLASYTGKMEWAGEDKCAAFGKKLDEALSECLDGGVLRKGLSGGLMATDLGLAAAAKGISVKTAGSLALFAKRHSGDKARVYMLDVLIALNNTEDGEAVYFNMSTEEYESRTYRERLVEVVSRLPRFVRNRYEGLTKKASMDYESTKRIKKTLILFDWVSDMPTKSIEKTYHTYSGSAASLAVEFSWLADALAAIAKVSGWAEQRVQRLRELSERLLYGVKTQGLMLAKLGIRGLGRMRIQKLVEKGVCTVDKVLATPPESLVEIVGAFSAERLLKSCTGEAIKKDVIVAQEEVKKSTVEEAEPGKWPNKYVPSDGLGLGYKSSVRIRLDGREDKRRRLVLINGKEIWLTEQSFETLLLLATAVKENELSWVACGDIGEHESYHMIVHRLRSSLPDGEQLIENNGSKHYRLSVPPANCEIVERLLTTRARCFVKAV